MIRSLRMRLFLGVTLVSALVLGVLAAAIIGGARRTLREEYDRVLLEKARSLASMVEQTGDTVHFDYQAAQFPEFEAGRAGAYFEILLEGKQFARSASLGEGHLPRETGRESAAAFTLPDGRRGRLLVISFRPLQDNGPGDVPAERVPQGRLAVAQDSEGMERTLARLALLTGGLCAAAALLSGAAMALVATRAVRPVRALAAQIEALRETDLSPVSAEAALPSELMPVVERLNGLIARMGDVLARERGFTADVAHELRTPVAGLIATLEVARLRPRGTEGYEAAIDKALAQLAQMRGLVENLLLLARADAGQITSRRKPVDLVSLLAECRLDAERAAGARSLRLEMPGSGEPSPAALGDAELLAVVFRNLLENAICYADAGTTIDLRAMLREGGARVEIASQGHALAAADLPSLFERFVRKDAARAGTGVHAGLGLSICRRLMELQGGRIGIRLEGPRFVAAVDLPAA